MFVHRLEGVNVKIKDFNMDKISSDLITSLSSKSMVLGLFYEAVSWTNLTAILVE